MTPLTPRQLSFCDEYLVDLNGTQAAIRAGYSERTANEQAVRLLANVRIRENIDQRIAERSERVKLTADDVVRHVSEIIEADPRDLTEYRRGACRYCWGGEHLYQRTVNEQRRAFEEHIASRSKLPFDELGGIGYTPKREPHTDCPECYGDGEGYAYFRDTRTLNKEAARLFAGVKLTKHGVEIVTRNQDGNIKLLGEHLGVFSKRIELTGKDGKPIKTESASVAVTLPAADPIEAAQLYAQFIKS